MVGHHGIPFGSVRMYFPWENMPKDRPKRSIAVFTEGKATGKDAENIIERMIEALK